MKTRLILISAMLCSAALSETAYANSVICKKTATGAIFIRAKCKKNETKLNNISALVGDTGAPGASGAAGAPGSDGSVRVFGDGSAGALTISSNTTLDAANLEYTSVTINNGATLTVQSGTIFRCTGTFTNNGTVSVTGYSLGGVLNSARSGTLYPAFTPPSPGISSNPASFGGFGDNSATVDGGITGVGLNARTAKLLLHPGPFGGGGGAGGAGAHQGGTGGGVLVVLAEGAIANSGTISAVGTDGQLGSGGGGGGILILASKTSVTNSASGVLNVSGGDGGDSNAEGAAGGGGGGGFIHLISTAAPVDSGTATVLAGTKGSNATAVIGSTRTGGGGGGSCYGAGGGGADVSTVNASTFNTDGDPGIELTTTADPTSLLF